MIAALLCGLAFGALAVWERWARAEREQQRQNLLETLPPSDDEFDMEAWNKLSDEALGNFERQLEPAPYAGGADVTPSGLDTICVIGTPIQFSAPNVTVNGLPLDVWLQQFKPTSGSLPKRGI